MHHAFPPSQSKSLVTNPSTFKQLDDVGEECSHFLRGLPDQKLCQRAVPAFDRDSFLCARDWFDGKEGRVLKQGMFGWCGALSGR